LITSDGTLDESGVAILDRLGLALEKAARDQALEKEVRQVALVASLPVQMERVAAKSAAGKLSGQVLETTSEIANKPLAVHSGNAGTAGNSSPGEEKQRAKLLKFLNAPASQGMRPQMRQAGRHWAEGCSKGDVARKLNMDPSIIGRMINGALKMADARG
jgi:hypothetical protein